ncbi:unnamed protein product [Parascedosporium putredinis]|uniref:FAD-binding domain-containing protein n=1 Tax=Parascedosporium putredinis TaxID=1442378 RepID=A0A9P1GVX6_9PEZI|nr:unnamed protein product [Parascedosporium putredinis]CAI7988918.1 unnamed protein product [Parascedosporium putredinis]
MWLNHDTGKTILASIHLNFDELQDPGSKCAAPGRPYMMEDGQDVGTARTSSFENAGSRDRLKILRCQGRGPERNIHRGVVVEAGFRVRVYERYPYARPAGNILNLWPPPIHALQSMGVDIKDIGAPCTTTFRNAKGHIRADVQLPDSFPNFDGGGFVGLLRPDLYSRMLEAIPADVIEFDRQVVGIEDRGDHVRLTFADGKTVTAGVLRSHHLQIIGGFTFADVPEAAVNECVLMHNDKVQGTYSSILSKGRKGHQWWILQAWTDGKEAPKDLRAHALDMAKDFTGPLKDLVAATSVDNYQTWPIRDRVPLKKWSKGRITLAGDAAHATSPYAAYGAGMSICDGYFIGQSLHRVNLADTAAVAKALEKYEGFQIEHTTEQVNGAYFLGRLFHHIPFPLTFLRDLFLDNTSFLQKQVGEKNPGISLSRWRSWGLG